MTIYLSGPITGKAAAAADFEQMAQSARRRYGADAVILSPMRHPVTLKEANAYVEQHHRHHQPVVGHKFSIGCSDGEKIVGVAIVGRPVSRLDQLLLEVDYLECRTRPLEVGDDC